MDVRTLVAAVTIAFVAAACTSVTQEAPSPPLTDGRPSPSSVPPSPGTTPRPSAVADERPKILTGGSFAMTLVEVDLKGRVLVRNGCLVIDNHGAEWIPIWPRPYELIQSTTGVWLVTDGGGGPVAGVGGRVAVLGGEVIPDMSIHLDCQRAQARFFAVSDVPPPGF